MRKLWPCGPTHLNLGALLLYGMLRAAAAACSGSGCFEACEEGVGGGAGEKVFVRRCGCRALRMFAAEAGGGRRRGPRKSWKLFVRRDAAARKRTIFWYMFLICFSEAPFLRTTVRYIT